MGTLPRRTSTASCQSETVPSGCTLARLLAHREPEAREVRQRRGEVADVKVSANCSMLIASLAGSGSGTLDSDARAAGRLWTAGLY